MFNSFKVKPGQYYYAPHRNMWGVWKRGDEHNEVSTDSFIIDFTTKIQARDFVYKMNGYTLKTN